MKTKFFYGMAAISTLGLAACSNDVIEPNGGHDTPDGDKSYYVNVAISGDVAGTRAGTENGVPGDDEFENGNGAESEVKNAYFVFYNAQGEMIGNVVNATLQAVTNPTQAGTVESTYYQVVRVDTYKGQGKPAKVMCYINPASPSDLQNPLSTIETITRDRVMIPNGKDDAGNDKYLFPMSNSVHFHNAGNSTSPANSALPVLATPIDPSQIFDTEAQAKAAAEAAKKTDATDEEKSKVLDIYVERYASKLTLTMGNNAISGYTTTTRNANNDADINVSLKFEIVKWALNAEAKTTYVVKSMRQATQTGQIYNDQYTYGLLDGRINAKSLPFGETGFIDNGEQLATADRWNWNSASKHRCFWAISPAYFTSQYPEVASDLDSDPTNQTYLSYTQILNNGYTIEQGATPHYYKETTVGAPALASKNPAAAMPSVVIIGNYTLSVNGTALTGNPSFYTYMTNAKGKPYVYLDDQTLATENHVMSMKERFMAQQSVLYRNVGTADKPEYKRLDPTDPTDKTLLDNALEVAQPSAAVKLINGEDFKLADRQRSLQFKENATTTEIIIADGKGYKTIVATAADKAEDANVAKTQMTVTEANAALMNQVGYAVFYHTGHGFFNIPVKHLGWYRPGNSQKNVTETNGTTTPNTKSIDWSLVRVGDFGMVRNHSYHINVSKITGLAAGVAGDNTPIIPPADTKDYYMVYRVNILKWAIVPTQNVDL